MRKTLTIVSAVLCAVALNLLFVSFMYQPDLARAGDQPGFPAAGSTSPHNSNAVTTTHTICPAGSPACDFSAIQDAVNAAAPDDVLRVAEGTYDENVAIDKSLILQGGWRSNFAARDWESYDSTITAVNPGPVVWVAGHVTVTIQGFRITGGRDYGAGVQVGPNDQTAFTRARIRDNVITRNEGPGVDIFGHASGTVTQNTITYNAGGGVSACCYAGASIRHNAITFNRGGGVSIGSYTGATIEDNDIIGNVGSTVRNGYGGGIGLFGRAGVTVSDNRILSNTAALSVTGSTTGYGGGIYAGFDVMGSATIEGNEIRGNIASVHGPGYGGGHYGDGSLQDNLIINNTASVYGEGRGGGVYAGYQARRIRDTLILGNVASEYGEGDGGGLFVYAAYSGLTVENTTIRDNFASRYGGGVFHRTGLIYTWQKFYLQGSAITDNVAGIGGGGVHSEDSTLIMTNNEIADNANGGISLFNGTLLGTHNTVVHNDLGLTLALTSSAALTNTILAGHTTGVVAGELSSVTLAGTLWGSGASGNQTDWVVSGQLYTGTLNIWADPGFADADGGVYALTPDSQARDAGLPTDVTIDIDGQPRPMGAGPDLGADEFYYEQYLPILLD